MSAKPPKSASKPAPGGIAVAQALHVDTDLRRLHEACAALGDPLAPFAKRVKAELARVKEGDQSGAPQVPLFVRGEVPLVSLRVLFKEALRPYPFLRAIQLHHCAIGDDGVLILCEFLKEYKPPPDRNPFGVQKLELPGCTIGERGCRYLGNLLINNSTVDRLVLDFNPFGDAGVQELCAGLRWNSRLASLSLQYCEIGPAGAESIAARVIKESCVTALSLRGNALGNTGVCRIARAISMMSNMEEVDLADTACTGDADTILALCDAIESANSLISVNLDLNTLPPIACECLLKALQARGGAVALRVHERADPAVYKQIVELSAGQSGSAKPKKKAES